MHLLLSANASRHRAGGLKSVVAKKPARRLRCTALVRRVSGQGVKAADIITVTLECTCQRRTMQHSTAHYRVRPGRATGAVPRSIRPSNFAYCGVSATSSMGIDSATFEYGHWPRTLARRPDERPASPGGESKAVHFKPGRKPRSVCTPWFK